jgi:hypothetical protein
MGGLKISQSLIKDFAKYKQGEECGLVVKAKFVDKKWSPPSEAQKHGIYFEYKATGSLPKSGETPSAEYDSKGRMLNAYANAEASASLFKTLIKIWNIKILETSWYMDDGVANGVADLLVEIEGKKAIIDLKYSGLLDDKWNDLGWHEDFLSEKDKILIQGVHYTKLAETILEEPVDFFFWVFNSKDPRDVRIFKQVNSYERYIKHESMISNVQLEIEELVASDSWIARPSLNRCNNCYLADSCHKQQILPTIKTIYY